MPQNRNNFKLAIEDDSISVCYDPGDIVLFTITKKDWETDFYKKKFGTIHIDRLESLSKLSDRNLIDSLQYISGAADKEKFAVIELTINIEQMRLIPIFEEAGFRLVDSRITFLTLINRDEYPLQQLPIGTVAYASVDDFDAIIELTHTSFVTNEKFFSRYKNGRYFTQEEAERYYRTWISENIDNPETYFVIVKDEDKIVAYYIYKKTFSLQNFPVYKAVLSAVDPVSRGNGIHACMQSHLFQLFPEKSFFVDNTSQLTNIPAMKSYIKSQKQLSSVSLVFYRLRNSDSSIF